MKNRHPCGGVDRRQFLAGAATMAATSGLRDLVRLGPGAESRAWGGGTGRRPRRPRPLSRPGRRGQQPGDDPGRRQEPRGIKATLDRGLNELTGADDAVDAWRKFFEPGDVVGIKVVPNGHPGPHLVRAGARGHRRAEVGGRQDEGHVRLRPLSRRVPRGRLSEDPARRHRLGRPDRRCRGPDQLDYRRSGNDPIAGYDPDEFVSMDLVGHGDDPKDDRKYRSHLGKLVTQAGQQDRRLPVPEGPRLGRRHRGPEEHEPRAGEQRRPLAQQRPTPTSATSSSRRWSATRSSARSSSCRSWTASAGSTRAGRSAAKPEWTWEYNALLLATDPVAMDHVEWDIIDAKRKERGCPPSAPSASSASDPFGTRGLRHPPAAAHRPGRRPRAWGFSTTSRPAAGGTRSSTRSSTSPEGRAARWSAAPGSVGPS